MRSGLFSFLIKLPLADRKELEGTEFHFLYLGKHTNILLLRVLRIYVEEKVKFLLVRIVWG